MRDAEAAALPGVHGLVPPASPRSPRQAHDIILRTAPLSAHRRLQPALVDVDRMYGARLVGERRLNRRARVALLGDEEHEAAAARAGERRTMAERPQFGEHARDARRLGVAHDLFLRPVGVEARADGGDLLKGETRQAPPR